MELKRLMTQFIYRIEPKPEGGFIAHASDPTVAPIEAATREELQQKIQAKIAAGLATEFPGLKLPSENQELKFAFHIERKPGGEFSIQSADPNVPPIVGATHDEIECHFVEKLIQFVGKHFVPGLSQALAAQVGGGDIKVFVKRQTGLTVMAGGNAISFGSANSRPSVGSEQSVAAPATAQPADPNLGSVGISNTNQPITPESSSNWIVFLMMLAALILGALMYFFFRYR
jgi:hypothetical protein